MSLVIPTGFGSAAIEMRNSGDPQSWYMTFGVDLTDRGGDYEAAAGDIALAWVNSFLDSFSTTTTFVGVDLKVGQDGGDPVIVKWASGLSGTQTEPRLPQNCALLVTKNTALGGRKFRGRFFVPNVLPEDAVDNVGNISTGARTDYQLVANQLLAELALPTGVSPLPVPMVLLHNQKIGGTPAPTPITSLFVDPVISTQRRRLR